MSAKTTYRGFDWIIMVVGSACFFYYAFNFDPIIEVLTSASKMTPTFIVIGIIGILSLVELCRRCVGVPILCVAGALVVARSGACSAGHGYSARPRPHDLHLFYTTGGVIGTPINVCLQKFIVVFIVFGAFARRTGIAKFFIDLANKAAGASSGGPGEGRGHFLGSVRHGFRLLRRQHRHHRLGHHPHDEKRPATSPSLPAPLRRQPPPAARSCRPSWARPRS